jgi:Flp pilus assembly protein TadG
MNKLYKNLEDSGGSVAIILALSLLPLLISIGSLVDYGRAVNSRTHLQASLDAGLLAAAHDFRPEETMVDVLSPEMEQQIREKVTRYLVSSGMAPEIQDTFQITVSAVAGSIHATAEGRVPTFMLQVMQINNIPIKVQARVTLAVDEPIEVALSIDVTDSMAGNMADLRAAAQSFVNTVTSNGQNTNAKIALVPFVGAVNIGNKPSQTAWMDVNGNSQYHAKNLEGIYVARRGEPGCPPLDDGETVGGGDDNDSGWLDDSKILRNFSEFFAQLAGIAPAYAATPYELHAVGSCDLVNPVKINNFTLFELLPGVTWKGCVEARPEPYDIDDTPPNSSQPNTLWVPYFWPDGPDAGTPGYPRGSNDYILDGPYPANSNLQSNGFGRAFSALKYTPSKSLALIDEIPPQMKGPNRACPEPVLPLTNDYGLISTRIAALNYYEGSGTNTAEGVAWGWRMLSPALPFSEGEPYGQIRKIMVLMSDGKNTLIRENNLPFGTHYSSYGSIKYGRFPSDTDVDIADNYLDSRMSLACTKAKQAGIEIYVVSLGVVESSSQQLLTACATDGDHFMALDRTGSLNAAFAKIAAKLSKLHLAR